MAIPSEASRKCNRCGETKPLTEYYNRTNGAPHAECKECYKARVKARRTGPDRQRVLDMDNRAYRKKRKEIRDQVFEAYGGYRCVCCGETEPLFLSLDHIENDGGEFRREVFGKRTMAGYHTYRWLLRNNFPPGIQVMCMNCQHGKLMNNGVCPHEKNV